MNGAPDGRSWITAAERSARAASMEPAGVTPEFRPVEAGVPQGPQESHAEPAAPDNPDGKQREPEGAGPEGDRYRAPASLTDRLQRAVVGLIDRFIRAMRTPKASWQKA